MKFKFILIVFSSLFVLSCASLNSGPVSTNDFFVEKVVNVSNQSKNDIYIKANEWFVKTFVSAESVIEFQDKEEGKILGKYVFNRPYKNYNHAFRQVISIDVQDNKARIQISDPYFKVISTTGGLYGSRPVIAEYEQLTSQKGYDLVKDEWDGLINDFKNAINKGKTSW